MRIKIFTPNENGKIELTKDELEALLNESYRQGWHDKPYYYSDYYYSTASPSITLTGNTAEAAYACSINNSSTSITNACTEALEKDMETFKIALKEQEVEIL